MRKSICCRGDGWQTAPRRRLCFRDQFLQRANISAVIARIIDRRLCNEGRVSQTEIIQQHAERFLPNHSLPDMFVPIQLRSTRRLGVIAMPDLDAAQSDGGIQMLQRLVQTLLADDVVSRDMCMTGVDTSANRNDSVKTFENLR